MFGQYSPAYRGALTKGALIAAVTASLGRPPVEPRKIANNTLAYRDGTDRVIRLHGTDIVRFHRNGAVTIATGGWNTVTMRDRINGALRPLGWRVWTEKNVLHVTTPAGTFKVGDKLKLKANGEPLASDLRKAGALERRREFENVLIDRLLAKIKAGDLADPAGDPWLPLDGRPIDRDIALDWLRGRYATRWLVRQSILHAGHRPDAVDLIARLDPARVPRLVRKYLRASLRH